MNNLDLFSEKNNELDLFAANKAPAISVAKPGESGFIDEAIGVGEAALSIGSSMIAEPVAGLVGIAQGLNPLADEGAGAQAVSDVRESMTYQPRTKEGQEDIKGIGEAMAPLGNAIQSAEEFLGDLGFEYGGSVGGAIAGTLPTAALELLGLKGIRTVRGKKEITGITDEAADALKARGVDIDDLSDEGIVKVQAQSKLEAKSKAEDVKQPEEKQYQKILSNIEKKKTKKAAGDIMPDKAILDAAKELNIDLNPSHYSTNKMYIELEQKLKDRPGSTLNVKELKAIEVLGNRADELINELGGTTDKSLFDLKVKDRLSGVIGDLSKESGAAYNKVETHIPKATLVKAPESIQYIEGVISDLGGDVSRLNAAEKDLYQLSKQAEKGKLTYTALDRIRKDIGRGFRGKGVYKDEDSGLLKQAYKKISSDQQKIADGFDVGEDYALGRKLTADRKRIEDQSVVLFGKDVNKSLVPQMKASATALSKGDVSKFTKLINSLPENLRQEAAITMLGDLFVNDARSATGLSQGFVNAFKGLNRNATAKTELFKYLPKAARKRFNNIGKVATGLYGAKALENKSGTAKSLISAMDDGGMFKRLTDVGGRAAAAEGATTAIGIPGVGSAAVIASAFTKGRKSALVAADEFITSAIFTKAVKEAAEGNVKNANNMVSKSKEYKRWVKFANKGDIESIAVVGFIPWLIGQEGEKNEQ